VFIAANLLLLNGNAVCDSVKIVHKKNKQITKVFDVKNGCRLKSRTVAESKTQLENYEHLIEWNEKGKKMREVTIKSRKSRLGFPSVINVTEITVTWDEKGKKTKTKKVYAVSNF
jgi:NCAIR mutase (PurE)-related protein